MSDKLFGVSGVSMFFKIMC